MYLDKLFEQIDEADMGGPVLKLNGKNIAKYIVATVFVIAIFFYTYNGDEYSDSVNGLVSKDVTEETSEDGIVSGLPDKPEKITEKSEDVSETKTDIKEYHFKNDENRDSHYYKHGVDMGFKSAEEYEKAASDVVNNTEALHKLEKEDGDDVYYIEDTNEFVIVSKKGYIRTYFYPERGIKYYNSQ